MTRLGRLLALLASHLDQRNVHRVMKVVILVLAAWMGGVMADQAYKNPSSLNISGVILLAVLTLWYFVMVASMLIRPISQRLSRT